ncbi:MAG: hypothetical protein KAS32_10135 [Candidatus Peribacteraceae bacterium]|nr:hypothetical protein [Candidatus Peribacteraceae bacterium]
MKFTTILNDVPAKEYEDGEPCEHTGCASHVTHPCEKCGRKRASGKAKVIVTKWD